MSLSTDPQLIVLRGLLATAKELTDPVIVSIAEEAAKSVTEPLRKQFAACAEIDAQGVTGNTKELSDLIRLLITAEVVELVAKIG